MNYTITYGGIKSITYRFDEHEIMDRLRPIARKHAEESMPKSKEVSWDCEWWDDEDNGKLIIEFTCEFKEIDKTRTETG